MNGKHVNVASIKQKITGHKILCLLMAIMLCMLMVPRGLAFAADKANDAKAKEAQKAQKADPSKEEVKKDKSQSESKSSSDVPSAKNGPVTAYGDVELATGELVDGGEVVIFLFDNYVNPITWKTATIEDGEYSVTFNDVDYSIAKYAFAICTGDGCTTQVGYPDFDDTTESIKCDFTELNLGANLSVGTPELGTYLDYYYISADSSWGGTTIGEWTGGEDLNIGRAFPYLGLPAGSSIEVDEFGQLWYENVEEELYLCFGAVSSDPISHPFMCWTEDGEPFEGWYDIKVGEEKELVPYFSSDQPIPTEGITIDGYVTDELGNPVSGAYVGYVSYSEEEGIDADYTMTNEYGYYAFDVAPGYYVFAATDLETGYDITEPDLYLTDAEVDLVLSSIEIPEGALVYFNNDNPDIDHYDFSIYIGEGDDIDNMEEVPEAAFSDFQIPVWFLFAGSEVYTIGPAALGFRTTLDLDFLGLGEVSLGLVCEPVVKDGLDRLPYCWTVTNEEGEIEIVPWIDSFVVEDSDDIYYVDLVTASVGYMCVDGTEGLNHFNLDINIMGEDIDLEETEIPGFDYFPVFADEELGLVQYFDIEEDGTLVASFEDPDTEWSRTVTLQPEALPGYEFSHWCVEEVGVESYDLEEGEYTWMDAEGEHFDFHAVFVPEGSGPDKDQAHGVAQTGDDLPFALVGGIALIVLASLGVALYSRKRFDV